MRGSVAKTTETQPAQDSTASVFTGTLREKADSAGTRASSAAKRKRRTL